MNLLHKLKTASTLSLRDWKLVLEAYGILLKTRLFLATASNASVAKAVENLHACQEKLNRPDKETLERLFWIASRYQGKPSCLARALAKRNWFRRYGFDLPIRIGVRRQGHLLKAHAWCEDEKMPPFEVVESLNHDAR